MSIEHLLIAATPAGPNAADALADLDLAGAVSRVEQRLLDLVGSLPGLVIGLSVLVVTLLVSRWVRRWQWPYRRIGNPFLRDLARQFVPLAVFLLGALIALDVMQATSMVAALLGTAGLAGLAIGFAFKDLVENYIAGLLLSLRQPFAPDDLVAIDGEAGLVVRLTLRATVLMTPDGNHLRLPNAKVFKATILNYTRNPRRRFDIGVGVGVDADLLQAQRIGLETLAAVEGVMGDPPPRAVVEELGDSNVLVRFYGWVDQRGFEFAQVKSESIRLVKSTLEDAEIDMPEPIYRVKMVGGATSVDRRPAEQASREKPTAASDQTLKGEVRVQSMAVQDDLRTALEEEKSAGEDNLLESDAARE